ncbi:MAG: hypothetical protein EOP08_08740 [Proteobacteria bacterium]|nr:MAG: hypothetical protein EOP08_08740 [Pseudomonadota bacterium]
MVALALGVPALLLDLLALVSVWPEFSHNWVLLLLWPTDLALPWLRERALLGYVKARIAVAAVLAAAELVGLVHQPILPVALFAALPMLGMLLAHRVRSAQNRVAVAAA